ncbi:hypothetical protein BGZ96_002247 [Linnemannia gamsii]|uniref:Uncharacterized protein n=1 Tax=Linnemannia gamsii TaxID=64522 RepID=A0ABQ7JL58_9FUNG|nr:hypothetical protein BGZ96_002247 [Linnemannia gamsii]
MAYNYRFYIQLMRHAEFDPSPLPDTVVSYTEGSNTEPATDHLPDNQDYIPIQSHDTGIGTANTYVESGQEIIFVDDAPIRHVELDPSPLPDTVVSYMEDPIIEATIDQPLDNQDHILIQSYDIGTGTANTYVESSQEVTIVDDTVTIDFTIE